MTARPSDALSGSLRLPGDKSISHRALMFGGLAVGETTIDGLLEGEDVLRTAAALRALGAEISRDAEGRWHVWGRGVGGLGEPEDVLDMGNSGTGARLLLGILASHPLTAVLTGDASLRRRPMARVTEPLSDCGATFIAREGGRLPLTVIGARDPLPLDYRLPVPSAQVKSAVLLAGLNAPGTTRVVEREATRDHSERMLRHFGAEVVTREIDDEGHPAQEILLTGQPELTGRRVLVPADPSSAAFPLVAALLLPGSEVRLTAIGMNPQRIGLITTLKEMGGDITLENAREEGGEPVADLLVRGSKLRGVEVPAERAPSMIDEYPVLAMAAAVAEGRTVMHGLGELRVKESDRLATTARGLALCGVEVEERPETLVVQGAGGRPPGGNNQAIQTELDHRIAMSFLVLGLAAERPVQIDDMTPIATSFPDFTALMTGLGAEIAES
ncbi:3-phosphoshikimate 1-carboxyvinyltransferase [Pelagibius marinus]|uniref:3-phosphoshikimate 1-carboxyvinyltransferase n=1 Tax=Pelagibius marinus TaxID=2762760 RepID=UPI001872DBC8|nr:3-phosphoshikimate 1-carboxyvinyltransferase [Pelagibius marinus]